jgi:AcrR family transcriptional regulator
MARLTRAESKANTRAQLLDAGERAFAALGYHGTTIEEIAERAGFTRGAFYANFADKADLFLTLLEDRNETNLQGLRAHLDSDQDRSVGVFMDWFERGFAQSGPLEVAYSEFQALAANNPDYMQRFAQRLRDVRRTVSQLIEDAAARTGVVLAIPADEFATMAIALVDGFAVHHRLDPDATPPTMLAAAVQYLWQGTLAAHQPITQE